MAESKTERLKDAAKWLENAVVNDENSKISKVIHLKHVFPEIFETLNLCVGNSLQKEG